MNDLPPVSTSPGMGRTVTTSAPAPPPSPRLARAEPSAPATRPTDPNAPPTELPPKPLLLLRPKRLPCAGSLPGSPRSRRAAPLSTVRPSNGTSATVVTAVPFRQTAEWARSHDPHQSRGDGRVPPSVTAPSDSPPVYRSTSRIPMCWTASPPS